MGLCFSSLSPSAPHSSSSLIRPQQHSGSASTDSMNVGFSATTRVAGKSQISEIESGSFDGEGSLPLPGQILKRPKLKVFTFEDLKSATKNFRLSLHPGGFGRVYKGWLDEKTLTPTRARSGMVVAIKRLSPESNQGFQQWQAKVNLLGRLSHPNLIKLLGFCWDDEELLLVYEFMPKGSLADHLFRRNPNRKLLSWNTRIKIAIGAARGLAFLHTSEKQVIISRDFKPSNLLLDGNYNAKISHFGLATVGSTEGESNVSITGPVGYIAPEYIRTGNLSVKSDVYSFGVVLVELLTGMRARAMLPSGRRNLDEWIEAWSLLSPIKKKLKTTMDAKIEGQYAQEAAFQAAHLSLKCIEPHPEKRPSMKDVLVALEVVQDIQVKSEESRNLNSH